MTIPKLVIFDCDGVVIDSEIISARTLIEELALHDVNMDLDYVARHFLGRSYPVVLAQVRKDFGIILPDSFEADYRARLLNAFQSQLTIIPGIRELLEALGVPYCLATSSSPERVKQSLALVGLSAHFSGRISTASEVARGKPAPDLFLLAASRNEVQPEDCLIIEDSFAGIQAGLSANMQVWHFTGGSHLKDRDFGTELGPAPHRRFNALSEFFQMAPELHKEFSRRGSVN